MKFTLILGMILGGFIVLTVQIIIKILIAKFA